MAHRLGGEFLAEAHGMTDALHGLTPVSDGFYQGRLSACYERGYRDAQEIIAVESTLAARHAVR